MKTLKGRENQGPIQLGSKLHSEKLMSSFVGSRDSSVGRTSDWRSEGRVFNPCSPHHSLFHFFFAGTKQDQGRGKKRNKKVIAAAGDRTRVTRVTGENSHHYTNDPSWFQSQEVLFIVDLNTKGIITLDFTGWRLIRYWWIVLALMRKREGYLDKLILMEWERVIKKGSNFWSYLANKCWLFALTVNCYLFALIIWISCSEKNSCWNFIGTLFIKYFLIKFFIYWSP